MYASLSLELFMHPLLVLLTWQNIVEKKKNDSAAKGEFANSQHVWLFPFSPPTIMLASLISIQVLHWAQVY